MDSKFGFLAGHFSSSANSKFETQEDRRTPYSFCSSSAMHLHARLVPASCPPRARASLRLTCVAPPLRNDPLGLSTSLCGDTVHVVTCHHHPPTYAVRSTCTRRSAPLQCFALINHLIRPRSASPLACQGRRRSSSARRPWLRAAARPPRGGGGDGARRRWPCAAAAVCLRVAGCSEEEVARRRWRGGEGEVARARWRGRGRGRGRRGRWRQCRQRRGQGGEVCRGEAMCAGGQHEWRGSGEQTLVVARSTTPAPPPPTPRSRTPATTADLTMFRLRPPPHPTMH
jgi:hypothetical protein